MNQNFLSDVPNSAKIYIDSNSKKQYSRAGDIRRDFLYLCDNNGNKLSNQISYIS